MSFSSTSRVLLSNRPSEMRVQTEEWWQFISGVRMYKGKKTLFYNGEILWDVRNRKCLIYDEEEQKSLKVVIVLPGVEVIPYMTFSGCENIEIVIMADGVQRIEEKAFAFCDRLEFFKLSTNLELIGRFAFQQCVSLSSMFIPPSCREIRDYAFHGCKKLIILGIHENTQLGRQVFQKTALIKKSPIEKSPIDSDQNEYAHQYEEEAVRWVKSINQEEKYALHQTCAFFNPLSDIIHALVKRKGIKTMRTPNAIGIMPSQYLAANPFNDISEKEIVNRYVLDMMGEVF